jgi:hypothetical protein
MLMLSRQLRCKALLSPHANLGNTGQSWTTTYSSTSHRKINHFGYIMYQLSRGPRQTFLHDKNSVAVVFIIK